MDLTEKELNQKIFEFIRDNLTIEIYDRSIPYISAQLRLKNPKDNKYEIISSSDFYIGE